MSKYFRYLKYWWWQVHMMFKTQIWAIVNYSFLSPFARVLTCNFTVYLIRTKMFFEAILTQRQHQVYHSFVKKNYSMHLVYTWIFGSVYHSFVLKKLVPSILQANISGLIYGLLLANMVLVRKVFKSLINNILLVNYVRLSWRPDQIVIM